MKNLVKFPFPDDEWEDTGEGGMAVFFILLKDEAKRNKCLEGDVRWMSQDVVLDPPRYQRLNKKINKYGYEVDLAMLADSTKRSLYSESEGYYFIANEKTLTKKGKELFDLLTKIYGQKPDIVTLLDT